MPSQNRAIYKEWASSVLGITGPVSLWPQRICTVPDVAVRRRQVESEYFRMRGTHVTAGTEYPHLPLSFLSLLIVCVCVDRMNFKCALLWHIHIFRSTLCTTPMYNICGKTGGAIKLTGLRGLPRNKHETCNVCHTGYNKTYTVVVVWTVCYTYVHPGMDPALSVK